MDGTTIMLIPDDKYVAARPDTKDHHLTVAFFGKASEMTSTSVWLLHHVVKQIHERWRSKPLRGVANGIGLFPAADGAAAVVDLIDGMDLFYVRQQVEALTEAATSPLEIDRTHGFTPHITRRYIAPDLDQSLDFKMVDALHFTFNAVGLWHGDQRFELTL